MVFLIHTELRCTVSHASDYYSSSGGNTPSPVTFKRRTTDSQVREWRQRTETEEGFCWDFVGTSFTVLVGDLATCLSLVQSHSNCVTTFLKISNKAWSQHRNGISFTNLHIADPLNHQGLLERERKSAVIPGRSVRIFWTDLAPKITRTYHEDEGS